MATGICPICKQYDIAIVLGHNHTCDPEWECAVQDEAPDREDDGVSVRGHDAEDAARNAAAHYESYQCSYDHSELVVWIRPILFADELAPWQRFEVECFSVREYQAVKMPA